MHSTYLWNFLRILTRDFDWLYFIHCLTPFSYIDHFLHLCTRFLMLLMFSQSPYIQMHLSFEASTSNIRTSCPILVEPIGLVSSVIIFAS